MIEIIREEQETQTVETGLPKKKGLPTETGLPKEIRQIGTADIGDRIYLGERVYQYLHRQCGWENDSLEEEKKLFVLLGRMETYNSQKCVFVEYAVWLEEIEFNDGMPIWSDKTWAYIFQKMKHLSEEMIVVGWAMDIKGGAPSLVRGLSAIHMTHFGGRHQVLFLMDSIEKEENFFCNRQGELQMREGFYLYRDKRALAFVKEKERPAEVTIEHESAKQEAVEQDLERLFWENEQPRGVKAKAIERMEQERPVLPKETIAEKVKKWRISPTYLLAVATLVLVFFAYRNNSRMKELQETLSQMDVAQTMFAEDESEQTVAIETVGSQIEKQTTEQPNDITDSATTDVSTDMAATTGEPTQVPETQTTEQTGTSVQTTPEATVQSGQEETSASEQDAAQTTGTAISAEAQTYIDQGYYVVQKGDSLAGICMKLYQTTAMMDKVCEVNEIENPDEIYAGQCLTLPN